MDTWTVLSDSVNFQKVASDSVCAIFTEFQNIGREMLIDALDLYPAVPQYGKDGCLFWTDCCLMTTVRWKKTFEQGYEEALKLWARPMGGDQSELKKPEEQKPAFAQAISPVSEKHADEPDVDLSQKPAIQKGAPSENTSSPLMLQEIQLEQVSMTSLPVSSSPIIPEQKKAPLKEGGGKRVSSSKSPSAAKTPASPAKKSIKKTLPAEKTPGLGVKFAAKEPSGAQDDSISKKSA